MKRKELDEIRARMALISQGEWRETEDEDGDLIVEADPSHHILFGNLEGSCITCHANQRFVAHARDDMEKLIAEVESCWRRIGQLTEYVDNGWKF